jgi:hypothetical protein
MHLEPTVNFIRGLAPENRRDHITAIAAGQP